MDEDVLAIAAAYAGFKRTIIELKAFKERAEPILAQVEELLAERERLKGLLRQCASQEQLADALLN